MPTILVVEDEAPIAQMIVAVLSDAGFKVVVAGNGAEALACLTSFRLELILSDIMMPIMDGRELCKRLHSHPEHSSIPIVLMSAAYSSIKLDGCNYAAILKKPFVVEELLATVRQTIGEAPVGP